MREGEKAGGMGKEVVGVGKEEEECETHARTHSHKRARLVFIAFSVIVNGNAYGYIDYNKQNNVSSPYFNCNYDILSTNELNSVHSHISSRQNGNTTNRVPTSRV